MAAFATPAEALRSLLGVGEDNIRVGFARVAIVGVGVVVGVEVGVEVTAVVDAAGFVVDRVTTVVAVVGCVAAIFVVVVSIVGVGVGVTMAGAGVVDAVDEGVEVSLAFVIIRGLIIGRASRSSLSMAVSASVPDFIAAKMLLKRVFCS